MSEADNDQLKLEEKIRFFHGKIFASGGSIGADSHVMGFEVSKLDELIKGYFALPARKRRGVAGNDLAAKICQQGRAVVEKLSLKTDVSTRESEVARRISETAAEIEALLASTVSAQDMEAEAASEPIASGPDVLADMVVNRGVKRATEGLDAVFLNMDQANARASRLEQGVQEALHRAKEVYDEAREAIEVKHAHIDGLLDLAARKVMTGDYEWHAAAERRAANHLRWWSLGCMGASVSVAAYTLWESGTGQLEWQVSLFRLVFASILSIPAAYLARESAKHREQQYAYSQRALDLKTITPYIASLPETEQHKIKVEVAARLFATGPRGKAGDSYPINVQELMMELIKKVGPSKPDSEK